MLNKLPEKLQEWLDGELPGEDYRHYISRDTVLRKAVRNERQLRLLIGHAFTLRLPESGKPAHGHINTNDMAAYFDQALPETKMHQIHMHLVRCKPCFYSYMKLHLLNIENLQPEPLPAPLHHQVLEQILPNDGNAPGWLGELVLQARGGIEWLFEPVMEKLEDMNLSLQEPSSLFEAGEEPEPDEVLDVSEPIIYRNEVAASMDMTGPASPQPFEIEVAGLTLELLQRRVRGVRALSIDVVTTDDQEPVAGLELSIEFENGETTHVITDRGGHAYFLVPRGRSWLNVGAHGHFDIVVE